MCIYVYKISIVFCGFFLIAFLFSVIVTTGFVSVQVCTQASCASLQVVKTTHVEMVPPVFPNPEQTLSASAHTGDLDPSALKVRALKWGTGRER